jgi:choline kinase
MKAIILAAGRGSRMGNLTEDIPKCLVKLKGKPLIEWQIDALKKAGIEEIGIVTGYKRELLCGYGLKEFHNSRWASTQMVSSLECTSEWLDTTPCIVSYSDIFYQPHAVSLLMESNSEIAITYDPNWQTLWENRFSNPLEDAETFRLNEENAVTEIGSKPKNLEEVEGQYMGLLYFTPSSWGELMDIRSKIPQNHADKMHMTNALQKIIDNGNFILKGIPYTKEWGEVDNSSDLEFYNR